MYSTVLYAGYTMFLYAMVLLFPMFRTVGTWTDARIAVRSLTYSIIIKRHETVPKPWEAVSGI